MDKAKLEDFKELNRIRRAINMEHSPDSICWTIELGIEIQQLLELAWQKNAIYKEALEYYAQALKNVPWQELDDLSMPAKEALQKAQALEESKKS